jgi:zinc protease
MFIVYAVADPDHSLAQIEKTIDQVIQSFIDEPVAAADLNRVKQNLIADAIYAQEDLKTLAYIYGQSLATGLSTDYIENWETEIEKITAHDVQEAARYVFNRNASVTGYLMKPIEQE